MVYRYFFPKGGGGFVRRYKNFQKQMLTHMWETPNAYPFAPVTLFDFNRTDDAADILPRQNQNTTRQRDAWRLSDDRVIGGYSDSSAHLIRPPLLEVETESIAPDEEPTDAPENEQESNYENVETEETDEEDSSEDSSFETQEAVLPVKRPFLRWYGHLDTTIGLESKARRSGFVALRSPPFSFGGANLQGAYTALEITCRSDGRVYTINLQVDTALPENIYQGHIDVPATEHGQWDRLYLPFSEFGLMGIAGGQYKQQFATGKETTEFLEDEERRLARNYRQEHFHRKRSVRDQVLGIADVDELMPRLDNQIRIESIGFTLMDGQNGPFHFDLASIRAVNFFEDDVWEGEIKKRV